MRSDLDIPSVYFRVCVTNVTQFTLTFKIQLKSLHFRLTGTT